MVTLAGITIFARDAQFIKTSSWILSTLGGNIIEVIPLPLNTPRIMVTVFSGERLMVFRFVQFSKQYPPRSVSLLFSLNVTLASFLQSLKCPLLSNLFNVPGKTIDVNDVHPLKAQRQMVRSAPSSKLMDDSSEQPRKANCPIR